MKKIIALGGSNSKHSINKQLASYAANQSGLATTIIDLNDFEMPLYGIDLENDEGIPQKAHEFLNLIKENDGVIVSLAEHNGAYSAAFKNIYDWVSRIDGKLWSDKPMLLMATSPGGRGGQTVLEIAADRFPRMGANVVATYSLPSFGQNFSEEGIADEDLNKKFSSALQAFKAAL